MARLPSLLDPPIAVAAGGASAHEPPNSISAFELASRLGAGGQLVDLRVTADGRLVLHRDSRTGGRLRRRSIADTAAQELATITSLDDLLTRHAPSEALLLFVHDERAVAPALEALGPLVGTLRLWLAASDDDALAEWAATWPDRFRTVHVTEKRHLGRGIEVHAARLAEGGVDALALPYSDWTGGSCALLHRFERFAFATDASHDRMFDELLDMGIDAVVSDQVERMVDRFAAAGYEPLR